MILLNIQNCQNNAFFSHCESAEKNHEVADIGMIVRKFNRQLSHFISSGIHNHKDSN
jgi:hypothetical protein